VTNRFRVLIAEDEEVVAQALAAQLEGDGYRVMGVAADGHDAVAKAASLEPDLIFLDIKMPRQDGLEAARQIMAARPVPIILITGFSDPDLVKAATEAGVMGYLLKPLDPKALRPAILLALSRFAEVLALRQEVESLHQALALRQQVEKAKGILARRMGLPEALAQKRIQAMARRDRSSLGEAAERIIAAERFFAELDELD